MAANSINTFVVAFSDRSLRQETIHPTILDSSIAYQQSQTSNIRTLSTNTNSSKDPSGFIYVPDLQSNDPCTKVVEKYVPPNVTRRTNVPTGSALIGLAPWISADCTLSYLASARADAVRAFIFYLTGNSNSEPPQMNDRAWGLNDGGEWKTVNQYPVYAIPSQTGDAMMRELSHYSGNLTDVKNGDMLSKMFDSREFIRMYTEVDIASQSILPSLWAFLLIIAGVLLFILATTSLIMHGIQSRHRRALRRRVANGEVDLEILGIKRLRVPSNILNNLPLFVYVAGDGVKSQKPAKSPEIARKEESEARSTTPTEEHKSHGICAPTVRRNSDPTPSLTGTPIQNPAPALLPPITRKDHTPLSPPLPPIPSLPMKKSPFSPTAEPDLPHRVLPYSQSTCSICLDDFESRVTIVRELPCEHVFHPECVDTFLKTNSSLCPLCKKSVLPMGYCPKTLTNAMVRRERMARRSGERATSTPENVIEVIPADQRRPGLATRSTHMIQQQLGRVRRITSGGRRIFSAPTPSSVEMGVVHPVQPPLASPPVLQRVPTQNRREWARRRASAMLGHPPTAEEEEQARQATLPKWRKAIVRIFPGFS